MKTLFILFCVSHFECWWQWVFFTGSSPSSLLGPKTFNWHGKCSPIFREKTSSNGSEKRSETHLHTQICWISEYSQQQKFVNVFFWSWNVFWWIFERSFCSTNRINPWILRFFFRPVFKVCTKSIKKRNIVFFREVEADRGYNTGRYQLFGNLFEMQTELFQSDLSNPYLEVTIRHWVRGHVNSLTIPRKITLNHLAQTIPWEWWHFTYLGCAKIEMNIHQFPGPKWRALRVATRLGLSINQLHLRWFL